MRASVGLLLAATLLASACSQTRRAVRRLRAERHLAIAKVFESPEPYATRKVTDADLAAFFAKGDEYTADSGSVADFYQARSMQFAWILGDTISASAEAFVALAGIDDADGPNATKASRRLTTLYDDAFSSGKLCDSCAIELELRLTAAFYHFIDGEHGGYLNHDLNELIPPNKRDFNRLLDSLTAGQMDLTEYEPIHPQYQLLKQQIKAYARLDGTRWSPLLLPPGIKQLKWGDTNAVIMDVGKRLFELGDRAAAPVGTQYDSISIEGVKRFQTRHGMTADGVIDSAVMQALNVKPNALMRIMLINMERLRWVSEVQSPNLLLVNIPEFRLHVIEDDHEVFNMNVVVGSVATSTIAFTDTMTQIVFSPAWNVPASIVRKDVLPGMRRDPRYLAKHHMTMTNRSNDSPSVRQEPGPANPLGHVKFLFPNSYSIYMHDTPGKGLFQHDQRAASHGCVRLAHADQLAEFLLRDDPEWPEKRMHDAMTSGNETFVRLTVPWPVAIVYLTAWVDRDGLLQFRNDVYGHDATLSSELFAMPGR